MMVNKESTCDRYQNIAKQVLRFPNPGCTCVELHDSCMRALDDCYIKWSKENNIEVFKYILI